MYTVNDGVLVSTFQYFCKSIHCILQDKGYFKVKKDEVEFDVISSREVEGKLILICMNCSDTNSDAYPVEISKEIYDGYMRNNMNVADMLYEIIHAHIALIINEVSISHKMYDELTQAKIESDV